MVEIKNIPIVVNFDNTAGISERDCDDLIALMYLIRKKADIPFVLTTFGNDTEKSVNYVKIEDKDMIIEELGLVFE